MSNSKTISVGMLVQISMFILGVAITFLGSHKLEPVVAVSNHPSLIAPANLKFFTLGYNQIVSDLLWLRTIQDFDYCENRPPGINNPSLFKCQNGWVYHMIDSTTEIDPNFRHPYLAGSLMLSVIVNDIEGASKIYDKATQRFPKDWQIHYYAAYHAMSEEHDVDKASRLLNIAAKNGGPAWTYSLAARLQQKSGKLELAKSILENAIETAGDQSSHDLFTKRLAEVDAELAKERAGDKKSAPKRSSRH